MGICASYKLNAMWNHSPGFQWFINQDSFGNVWLTNLGGDVCVCERERETDRQTDTETETETDRERDCKLNWPVEVW